jgi:hypothetical protein
MKKLLTIIGAFIAGGLILASTNLVEIVDATRILN